MRRVHAGHISSGAGDVLRHVVTPTADGWFDLAPVRLEPNLRDLRSPYLCNGEKRVAVSMDELYKASTYLPHFMAPEHSNIIGWIVLMHESQAQVFWKGGGICLFHGVEGQDLEVLRVIQQSMSHPAEREEIGVSFTDTILSLSDSYGCQGEHSRRCPVEGDRARSLIAQDGEVKPTLLKKLRDLGLASDT